MEQPVDVKRELEQIANTFKSELSALKDQLDSLWEKAPEDSRPVLNEMQKLISIHEEFNSIKSWLEEAAAVSSTISSDSKHIVKCLLCLEKSVEEWNAMQSCEPSENLLTFLEANSPDSQVTNVLSFQQNQIVSILTAAAAEITKITSQKDADREQKTVQPKNDDGKETPEGSHMSGDDSEYILFEHDNANEIPFKEVFRKEP